MVVAARTGQGKSLSYLRAVWQACPVSASLPRRFFFRRVSGSQIAEPLEYLHDVRTNVVVEAIPAAALMVEPGVATPGPDQPVLRAFAPAQLQVGAFAVLRGRVSRLSVPNFCCVGENARSPRRVSLMLPIRNYG